MHEELKLLNDRLAQHPLYKNLDSLENLRTFMKHHVFAVWDFMSLLKGLQRRLTCVEVPWIPSPYPHKIVRLINEIVLGEESDVDIKGSPISHFALYLGAMEEVGANVMPVKEFLCTQNPAHIPPDVREFVEFNLDLARNAPTHELCAAFFYGREKLVPQMFEGMVKTLSDHKINCPSLLYYLQRHISVDGEEHGPMALECMRMVCEDNPEKILEAQRAGLRSLQMRQDLWDRVNKKLTQAQD
ncbi:MAG TPA: DUF3050 domain-containing protein [Bacteriovoracaceae bacterium]|nr:DUF3050 domain-containing protein [Bacteriovoracaceae bacterium]